MIGFIPLLTGKRFMLYYEIANYKMYYHPEPQIKQKHESGIDIE